VGKGIEHTGTLYLHASYLQEVFGGTVISQDEYSCSMKIGPIDVYLQYDANSDDVVVCVGTCSTLVPGSFITHMLEFVASRIGIPRAFVINDVECIFRKLLTDQKTSVHSSYVGCL